MFLFTHLNQACKIQVGEKGGGLMHRSGNQKKMFLLQASLGKHRCKMQLCPYLWEYQFFLLACEAFSL